MLYPATIEIRDFTADDVPLLASYWCEASPEFHHSLGVRREALPSKEVFSQRILKAIQENQGKSPSQLSMVAIRYQDRTVGNHSLSGIQTGEPAVMHAHIFDSTLRGQGLGRISYLKAMKIFFERFDLPAIDFHTPALNPAPNRVKQSLGIPIIGELILNREILVPNLRAIHYRITREEFDALYCSRLSSSSR